MRTNASKQVQVINQLLKQQRKSITQLKLFEIGPDEQSSQMHSSGKKQHYFLKKQKLAKSSAAKQKLQYGGSNQQSNTKQMMQQYGDEDQIYKLNLSPVSRITLRNNQQKQAELARKLIPINQQANIYNINCNSKLMSSTAKLQFTASKSVTQIMNIPYQQVQRYFITHQQLFMSDNSPQQVYKLMQGLLDQFKVVLPKPYIKQYKNCTYFGQVYQNDANHQGFLIFQSQKKLYYGFMSRDKKHGRGTQIDFASNITYRGTFQLGRKKGVFEVIKQTQKYIGQLLNDKYEGKGKLFTDVSIYHGYFCRGVRHGQGEQFFPESGLKISGTFIQNSFSNSQMRLQESRMGQHRCGLKKSRQISKLNQNPQETPKKSKLQQSRYHYQGYNYDHRPNQLLFYTHNKKQIRKSGLIMKRRKSMEQQQPLARIIH